MEFQGVHVLQEALSARWEFATSRLWVALHPMAVGHSSKKQPVLLSTAQNLPAGFQPEDSSQHIAPRHRSAYLPPLCLPFLLPPHPQRGLAPPGWGQTSLPPISYQSLCQVSLQTLPGQTTASPSDGTFVSSKHLVILSVHLYTYWVSGYLDKMGTPLRLLSKAHH